MRGLGEKRLGAIPTAKQDRAYRRMKRKAGQTWYEYECSQCKAKAWMKEAYYCKLARSKIKPRCKECRLSDKDELAQAILNLALRKQAMKKN